MNPFHFSVVVVSVTLALSMGPSSSSGCPQKTPVPEHACLVSLGYSPKLFFVHAHFWGFFGCPSCSRPVRKPINSFVTGMLGWGDSEI